MRVTRTRRVSKLTKWADSSVRARQVAAAGCAVIAGFIYLFVITISGSRISRLFYPPAQSCRHK